ncbi:sulfotransferase family protein [Arenibaculum pallidiluteum]|uniref:sulfotransferase family protein n=1 Tax=Arenibaculum pallidiluteum TaxID=2812559 RepID=UPI001A966114|nr:sulfotransferase [Arenibaculum pallidiluteum]
MRLPDFIIGGAARSGTTWLYHAMDAHPGIALAKPVKPEPKFFIDEDRYGQGLGYYSRSWFADLPEGLVTGEKSTNYLESPQAAARIADALPEVRMIFVLRDPVDRAYSNWRWSVQNGRETENFTEALALEAERDAAASAAGDRVRAHAYFSRGLYADLLAPFFARLPRERILVLRYEDIAENPGAVAATAHGFVGARPMPEVARDLGRINEGAVAREERVLAAARPALTARYAEPNRRLSALLGPDFRIWT